MQQKSMQKRLIALILSFLMIFSNLISVLGYEWDLEVPPIINGTDDVVISGSDNIIDDTVIINSTPDITNNNIIENNNEINNNETSINTVRILTISEEKNTLLKRNPQYNINPEATIYNNIS